MTTHAKPALPGMHLPALNQGHRTSVFVACHEHKVEQGTYQNTDKNDRGPVEARRSDRVKLGPEAPEEAPERINDSRGIDWDAELTQGELSWRQRLRVMDPPPQQAADTETVALQQSYGEQGGDGVEGNGAAYVDEG